MFVVGLILILLGVLAILSAIFGTSGSASFLGQDLTTLAIFLIGVASAVAILWGYSLSKFGIKRSLQHRRERRRLVELSEKLDKVDEGRRQDADDEKP
jgi:hypothetical protein